jgi:hypothetical protein
MTCHRNPSPSHDIQSMENLIWNDGVSSIELLAIFY